MVHRWSLWVFVFMLVSQTLANATIDSNTSSSTTGLDTNGLPFVNSTGILTDETRRFVDSVMDFDAQCDQDTQTRILTFYYKNKQLMEQCSADSNYVIFPNSGAPPTNQQVQGLVDSVACLQVFTAAVQAQLPECNLDAFCPRSASEVLLRIRHDMVLGHRKAPTGTQFVELCYYNIAVNLLQDNETIYNAIYTNESMQDRFPLDALNSSRSDMYLTNNVRLGDDLVIHIDDTTRKDSASDAEQATARSPAPTPTSTPLSPSSTASTSSSSKSSNSKVLLTIALLAVGCFCAVLCVYLVKKRRAERDAMEQELQEALERPESQIEVAM